MLPLLAFVGCERGPPALEVGPVGFSESEVRGLGDAQLRTLARITAVGLAVRDGTPGAIGEGFLEERMREARIQRLREEVALERANVSERALEVHYASSPEWELEVRHLVVLSERWRAEEARREARRRAVAARERIVAGESFATVAGEVSDEPGARERGGLLEPGREGTWVREFWEAALELDAGEMSPVVETEYGFHVLQLEARRPVPFTEARDRVAAEVAARVADRSAWDAWKEAQGATDPAALLAEADRRDIEVPPPIRASIEREWDRKVAGWGAMFGFEPGTAIDEVGARALEGLGRSGQNSRIAREEIDRHGPSIDRAFEVRRGADR